MRVASTATVCLRSPCGFRRLTYLGGRGVGGCKCNISCVVVVVGVGALRSNVQLGERIERTCTRTHTHRHITHTLAVSPERPPPMHAARHRRCSRPKHAAAKKGRESSFLSRFLSAKDRLSVTRGRARVRQGERCMCGEGASGGEGRREGGRAGVEGNKEARSKARAPPAAARGRRNAARCRQAQHLPGLLSLFCCSNALAARGIALYCFLALFSPAIFMYLFMTCINLESGCRRGKLFHRLISRI